MNGRSIVLALACALPLAAQQPAAPPAQLPPVPNINGGLPYVSHDGKWISFVGYRGSRTQQIYVIGVDGSGEKLLVAGGTGPARWMPDGRTLYFSNSAGMSPSSDLMTVGIDGAAPKPFVTIAGRGAELSPDAKWIIASGGTMPKVHITRVARDGTGAVQLTDGEGMHFNGGYSPDGKQIAYARLEGTPGGPTPPTMRMWVMNADGSGKRPLANLPAGEGNAQWPSWSPDGKTIAVQAGVYSQNRATNTAHIWLLDVASGRATKLAAHDKPYLDETPSFFPDGKRIAFQSDRTGRMEVWVMNADGSGARQVTK